MKKRFNLKIIKFFAVIAFTVIIAIIIHSCKKETTPTSTPINIAAEMKQWLNLQKTDTVNSGSVNTLLNKVDWQSAHYFSADSGFTYLVASLTTTASFDDPNKTQQRYLVLTKQVGKITGAGIYELFGDKADINGKADDAIGKFSKSGINGFTGIVALYSWANSFKQSKTYANGIITGYSILASKPSNGKTAVQSTKKYLAQCIDWYLDTYINGELVDEEYEGTTCPGDTCAQEAIRNRKGVLTVGTNCNGGGGNGGSSGQNWISYDIIDSVKNPCLKAIVDSLGKQSTLNSQVTNMLRNTFGSSNEVNINFKEAVLTGNYANADAVTNGSQANLDVTFNTLQVSSGSKEYLAETAMHEIYHAYLYVNPSVLNNISGHLYMAQNYVTSEVSALRQMFPSLSYHDATCLVIAGYGDLQQNNPSAFSDILSAYNLTVNEVADTNNNFKTGISGTHCF